MLKFATKPAEVPANGDKPLDASKLAAEVRVLEEENKRLKALVLAKQNKQPTKCGYLFKYRPFSSGLFSNTWEPRFFTLNGSALQYYKSEKDTTLHPRGYVDVAGCIVEWEGRKKDNFFCFSVVDRSGLSLMRMSTSDANDAAVWVQALVNAGCERRLLADAYRKKSPLRGADVRWREQELGAKRVSPVLSPRDELVNRWSDNGEVSASSATHEGALDAAGDTAGSRLRPRGRGPADAQPPVPPFVVRSLSTAAREYTSDSGMSEAGAMARPKPQQRTHRRESQINPSTNLHTESRPSMLSADRIALTQHSGILNLMMLILVAANARLIVENLLKYGVLTSPANWLKWLVPRGNFPLLLCWPALALSVLIASGIEKLGAARLKAEKKASTAKKKKDLRPSDARRLAAKMGRSTEWMLFALHVLNLLCTMLVPSAVVELTHAEPVPGFFVVMCTVILWMKLVSYAHCNYDLRARRRAADHRSHERHGSPSEPDIAEEGGWDGVTLVSYPNNLTLANLISFLPLPTLIYQPSYPRSTRFRGRWVLWYALRLVALAGVMLIITEQYLQPTIANSLVPLRQLNWPHMIERVLKLSLPTLYGWIIMFYCLFHLWLNILAELTFFGDREFYKDWWNATDISDYWRLWNMPVHKWMLRHVYFPALRAGIPRVWAGTLVFAVSAFFHELLVGLPLHMVRCWAFVGVMSQVPLMFATGWLKRTLQNDQIGNFIFWITFCIVGQPTSLILYYHDWVITNRPTWLPPALHPSGPTSDLTPQLNLPL
ncbi:g8570 [Coccomyxa elongata]